MARTTSKDYIEAAAVVFALDEREADAKEVLRSMAYHERRRLIEALANLSFWITQVNAEPVSDGTLRILTSK
ncbi:MAG: hypothetical protein J2P41_15965 [Blastocatellia bacterium]|nr:hypothetical protein [Blastocatellia bacterium]